jgi:hypothetical protein
MERLGCEGKVVREREKQRRESSPTFFLQEETISREQSITIYIYRFWDFDSAFEVLKPLPFLALLIYRPFEAPKILTVTLHFHTIHL